MSGADEGSGGYGADDHGHGPHGHEPGHGHEDGHADHDHGHGHADHEDGHGHADHEDGHGHADHVHPRGVRGLFASIFAPHSHDPADSIDAALQASSDGTRALKVSLAVLAATAVLQLVIAMLSGSVALLADTVHNFGDALTALPLGLAFWLGRRPANRRYTYGYGRSEDLAGIFIVVMIALSSGFAAWEAVRRLLHPHGVSKVGWVIVAGVIGAVGNELVGAYRIRVGRRIGSAALVADGMHARTDGLTSLAVVVGAIGAALGYQLADPIVGLLITVVILLVLKNAARDVYRRLMDSVDPGLVEGVEVVLAKVAGVQAVEAVRIRWVGHELRAEAEIVSDADLSLADAHAIAEEARHQLLHRVPRLTEATIHTNPCTHDGRDHHASTEHHFPRRAH